MCCFYWYYTMLEINKIYNESCLDTMSKMPDNFVKLVVTSPPYDDLRTYDGLSDFKFEETAQELYRIIKDGGIVVWVVNDETKDYNESLNSFRQAIRFQEIGFKINDTMIYEREPQPGKAFRYKQNFEYMFVLSKNKPLCFNPLMVSVKYVRDRIHKTQKKDGSFSISYYKSLINKVRSNIWKYKVGLYHSTRDKFACKHPAIFPEKLARDHIISWSNENDLVYDPFMGSGTVAKMCVINKRNYIGSEINPTYHSIACKRASQSLEEFL